MIIDRAKLIKHPKTIIGVELLAALHEIILSIERNVSPILLFSDSILAVQAMKYFDDEESVLDDDLNETQICAIKTFIVKISLFIVVPTQLLHRLAQFVAYLSNVCYLGLIFPYATSISC